MVGGAEIMGKGGTNKGVWISVGRSVLRAGRGQLKRHGVHRRACPPLPLIWAGRGVAGRVGLRTTHGPAQRPRRPVTPEHGACKADGTRVSGVAPKGDPRCKHAPGLRREGAQNTTAPEGPGAAAKRESPA